MYRFRLYTFENPSGRDTVIEGFMSPGKNADVLFGLPFPFFNASGTPEDPAFPKQASRSAEPTAMAPSTMPKELEVSRIDIPARKDATPDKEKKTDPSANS